MAYTPELCREHSATLRRLAWALGMPMTKTLALIMNYVGGIADSQRICRSCRDETHCGECTFNQE